VFFQCLRTLQATGEVQAQPDQKGKNDCDDFHGESAHAKIWY
jgi:hypothetical protein